MRRRSRRHDTLLTLADFETGHDVHLEAPGDVYASSGIVCDMNDGLYAIGEVARLSGLPVPTVRFYSDAGLVPPVDRTPGGYRLYDREALSRLELIRTLRDLGVDLATITRVLAGARTLAEVADRQAEALETQLQTLRVRQAVLRYVAARGTDAEGLTRVNRLARLSDEQRRVLVSDLIDEATGGLDLEPGFAARVRLLPGLPAEAAPEQIEAWIELAHLVGDPDFRAGVRRAFERHAADRASGADGGDPESWRRAGNAVLEVAGAALADGLSPPPPRRGPSSTSWSPCSRRRTAGVTTRSSAGGWPSGSASAPTYGSRGTGGCWP